MKIDAIKCRLGQALESEEKILITKPTKLDLDSTDFVLNLNTDPIATVYLIRQDDLRMLRSCAGVLDRGEKDTRKGLTCYLFGKPKDRLPCLAGAYQGQQISRSIRQFLVQAENSDENRPFVISIPNNEFRRLLPSGTRNNISTLRISPIKPDNKHLVEKIEILAESLSSDQDQRFLANLEQEFIGESPYFKLIRMSILVAAKNPRVPVLILGETGTGKDRVARSIHKYSLKYKNKNIKNSEIGNPESINCGSIPTELFESELFGAVKGAYTGIQKDKPGLWEVANNGTLFLDEIGDLSPYHQVKILRVLSSGKILPVGEIKPRLVNARIISATNKNLLEMVKVAEKVGGFREDLYYRLKGITIRTVPLGATSPESMNKITQRSWAKIVNPDPPEEEKEKTARTPTSWQKSEDPQPLPAELIEELTKRSWPGNVRELRAMLFQLYCWFGQDNLTIEKLNALQYLEDHVWSVDPFSDPSKDLSTND